ncbi:uncharacterized protein LOC111704271 [Eurytemora carolleeae]|uniref:uncharacterized protein LOC111704271 n=1 Tax=Eurytemora carolleeae TaxID=1294199 RepID=UPI000C7819C3|nr:uncharacterized protein LOC111704271 [Eurytemora carolleeae]|eukprot:XP_023332243.1 uncharacterized protein LOC111704271 [Eurytemora affinis]
MKLLEKKLAEVKEEQIRTESGIEGEISEIQRKLDAVRMSLNEKLESMDEPSAPSPGSSHSHPSSPPLYPDLLGLSRSSSGYVGRDMHGSTGSSPQVSLASTTSTSSTRVDSD